MERFWTLKYIQQNSLSEITGTVFKENMVRADDMPLVLPVLGAKDLPRGAHVRVKLGEIDEITLDIMGTVVERLDAVQETASDEAPEEEDDEPVAGPIAIAVDMGETEPLPAIILPREPAQFQHPPDCTRRFRRRACGAADHSFCGPQAFNRVFEDTPLEVVLVNARSNEKPEKAQAIAQFAWWWRRSGQRARHLAAATVRVNRSG